MSSNVFLVLRGFANRLKLCDLDANDEKSEPNLDSFDSFAALNAPS